LLKNPAVKGIQTSKLEMIWIPDVKKTTRKKTSFPYLSQPQRNKNRHKCFFSFAKEADAAKIIYIVGTQLVYFSEQAGKLLQE